MLDATIAKKLLIKPENRVYVSGVPDGLGFSELPAGVQIVDAPPADVALIFVRDSTELEAWIVKKMVPVVSGGRFWLAYPKKTGAIRSDINRDTIWPVMRNAGWEANSQIALDDTWSALRFRPSEAGK
jgi:hypothetical protein